MFFRLIYDSQFIPEQQAEELMDVLRNTTKWHDKNIVIRGEEYPQPRLVAWYGPFPYTYSGATLEAAEVREKKVDLLSLTDNTSLLIYFRIIPHAHPSL